jgi:regulator of protease activity HflC (stomatin/prohibitin superfamily)
MFVVLMAESKFKYAVFFGIIIIVIAFFIALIAYRDILIQNIFWVVLAAVVLFLIWRYDFILQLLDYERAVIFRFGRVHRVGGPGWAWIWPVIETYTKVDLRIQTIDVPKQEVITKDSIELMIDAIIYMRVKKDNQSVVNAVIEVKDYTGSAQLFVVSALRDVVGAMPLSDVLSNIEELNKQLKVNLEEISADWGITIDSVEIKDIQIPDVVIQAMHEEKAAVQEKLARMERALAHKAEIQAVKEAAAGLDEKALAYYYIKAIEGMSKGKGSKIFFPAEFSKLAESFSNLTDSLPPKQVRAVEKMNSEYKGVLKDYVDKAVKKAKSEEKE